MASQKPEALADFLEAALARHVHRRVLRVGNGTALERREFPLQAKAERLKEAESEADSKAKTTHGRSS